MSIIDSHPYTYIAGPFFNAYQIRAVEDIKEILLLNHIEFFSPKDECLFKPGEITPQQVLKVNIEALEKSKLVVCITDGKDPGTMFEAGWAYANHIPIIYVWFTGMKEQKFNLVLAASGSVVRTLKQLNSAVEDITATGRFVAKHWDSGEINYE
jgi:hypothetical protein